MLAAIWNSGLNWAALINSTDLVGLVSGNSAISNTLVIPNGTGLDQFARHLAVQLTIATSSAILAGANITMWLAMLQQDGSTYGDGLLLAGVPATYTPPWPPSWTGGDPTLSVGHDPHQPYWPSERRDHSAGFI